MDILLMIWICGWILICARQGPALDPEGPVRGDAFFLLVFWPLYLPGVILSLLTR